MPPADKLSQADSFGLSRFVDAQAKDETYLQALRELRAGKKETHWMWFVFPQIDGLGRSQTAQFYAIHGLKEAEAYLVHPVLGPRLLECCQAILTVDGRSAANIFGSPDDMKLKSSMTLFAHCSGSRSEFTQVLAKYYSGHADQQTLDLLAPHPHRGTV